MVNVLPVTVVHDLFVQEGNNHIKNLILDYEKKNPVGMTEGSYVKAWASDYKTHLSTNVFSDYLNLILQYSQNLYNNLFSTKEILGVEDFWLAHYRKGDYTSKHSHGNSSISGCYYAHVEEGSSPIIFEGQGSIYPKSNTLIIFSSKLDHEVPVTEGERILMSFNLYQTCQINSSVLY